MRRLDTWLIDKHEQFAHWFQRWTGLTNFWLAKVAWVMFAFSMSALACVNLHERSVFAVRISFISTIFLLALYLWVRAICNRMEAHYLEGSQSVHFVTEVARSLWPVRLVFYGFHIYTAVQPYFYVAVLDGWFFVQAVLWTMLIPHSYWMMSIPLPLARQEDTEMLPSPAS